MSIYLQIPSITGSVTAKNYQGAIEISGYQFSGKRPVSQNAGVLQNRSAGFINYSDLVLNKANDKSSVDLLQYFHNAKVIPQISFQHLTTADQPECYMTNIFYDVLIKGIYENSHAGGVMEHIEMVFSGYEKRNMPLDSSHRPGSPQTAGYDLQKAQSA